MSWAERVAKFMPLEVTAVRRRKRSNGTIVSETTATPRTDFLKCYAVALGGCDGNPPSKEHYISKGLLERLGKSFSVSGLSWAPVPRQIGVSALTARVLCRRHNNELSPLDTEIARLYDALDAVRADGQLGTTVINGEYMERWGLKVLCGLIASGNAARKDGMRATAEIPLEYLDVLFGRSPMPEGWGFHAFVSPKPPRHNNVEVIINTYPPGDIQAGLIYGVTTMILGLYYITIMRKGRSPRPIRLSPTACGIGRSASISMGGGGSSCNGTVRVRARSSRCAVY